MAVQGNFATEYLTVTHTDANGYRISSALAIHNAIQQTKISLTVYCATDDQNL